MAPDLSYGSVVTLQCGNAGFLGISAPVRSRPAFARSPENSLVTTWSDPGRANWDKVRWQIVPGSGDRKEGDPVSVGDAVRLRSLAPGGGFPDTAGWVVAGSPLAGPGQFDHRKR
ncbi:hypothetical protein GCM10009836_48500 [Pseudonocardia ailaonensis]|uniref:Uncharacterized protein n=1 Tax=Pseudonocardia ailaonensis TaxID=367279 RepID=A0ABN2NE82_9PSEU